MHVFARPQLSTHKNRAGLDLCKAFHTTLRKTLAETRSYPFSTKQYGFIKRRSTVLQVLTSMDDWTARLVYGGQVDVIYTDFAKASDTGPRAALRSAARRRDAPCRAGSGVKEPLGCSITMFHRLV